MKWKNRNMKKLICTFITMAILLSVMGSNTAFAYSSGIYKGGYESMNLRNGPGLNFQVIDMLYKDQQITISEISSVNAQTWGKGVFNGKECWGRIDGGYLVFVGNPPTQQETLPPLPETFTSFADKAEFTTDESITLKWNTSANATSYGVTVSKNPYGSANAVLDRDGITGNSLDIGKLPAGEYRFNMVARNASGESQITQLTYFKVVPVPVPAPVITPLPGTFTCSADKAEFTTDESITLKWNTSANATSYGVTVSKNPYGSANAVLDSDGITGNSLAIGKLPAGEYRFNMVARNASGESPITQVIYFKVTTVVTSRTGYVSTTNGYTLNLRSEPTTANNIIAEMPMGAQITVQGDANNGFHNVQWNGKNGWASAAYISFEKPASPVVTQPAATQPSGQQSHTYYYQKDSAWGFGTDGEYACYVTSYAMVLKGLGINATPRDVYNVNGGNYCNHGVICKAYNVTINRVSVTNAEAEIIRALSNHPEGIMVRVSGHTLVARSYVNGTVYFDDPYINKQALPIGQTLARKWSNVIYYETLSRK